MRKPKSPLLVYSCPVCGQRIAHDRFNPPMGIASCDKCKVRLGLEGNVPTILAQTVDGESDLSAAQTNQLLQKALDVGLVVSRLRDDGYKALADPRVRKAIRRTDGYANMLDVVAKHAKLLELQKKLGTADALQGAYLLDKETLPEDNGEWMTPARVRGGIRWAKRQHPKFVRRSRKFLVVLDSYRRFVEQFKALEGSPKPLLATLDHLEEIIRRGMVKVPSLHGTPFRDFQKSPPHVLAAVRVASILRSSKALAKSQVTRAGAIGLCAAMLLDAGLVSRGQDPDAEERLFSALEKDLQRARRRQPS